MSKKLESILSRVPPATVTSNLRENPEIKVVIEKEKTERIVAVIPYSLKLELRKYLAENLGETERTLLMRGLKALGFNVKIDELKDKRGKKT